jgi:histidine triad (HIT) family protein
MAPRDLLFVSHPSEDASGTSPMTNAIVFDEHCTFCKIVRGAVAAHKVFEDDVSLGFLDHRPLFAGHTLFITKSHIETLFEMPDPLLEPLFANVRLLSRAVMQAMQAEGTFVAINNRVSQSVPHFHVHVVPRRKKDGLKGFFWPRRAYKNDEEIEATLRALHAAISALRDT